MYVEDIEDGVCSFYKMQHCIQSTVTHLTHAKYYCTLYKGPLTPPGGKASNMPSALWV